MGSQQRLASVFHLGARVAASQLQDPRAHWGIENSVHWVLDAAFNEDQSRVRKDHSPENLAVMRRIALNLLRKEKTAKGGSRPNVCSAPGMKITSSKLSPFSAIALI